MVELNRTIVTMQRSAVFLLLFVLNFLFQSCNSAPITGIYAGIQLRISAWVGGAMERDDNVYYFRPDGTFTNDLKDPNWKKTVKGNFKINGKELVMTYATGKKETLEITGKGTLSGGNYILFPMEMKGTIPASSFKYTGGSSAGGIGTNMAYVGTFSQSRIHFDGKGNFSHSRHSTVMISGDNIGGGSNNKKEDEGTYTYLDGVLTLKYNNGQTQTNSFFFTKEGEPIAAMNGRIYTKDDGKGSSSKSRKKTPEKLPAASDLVAKAREVHGGKAIDDIRNLKVISQITGVLVLSQSDYLRARTLSVIRASGKVVFTEYWDGQQGSAWAQGKTTPLTADQMRSKEANRYVGISGLHAQRMATLQKATVSALDNGGYELSFTKDGTQLTVLLDSKYQIVGEEIPMDGETVVVQYKNFRRVNGVLFPFTEIHTKGRQRTEIKMVDYFVNELQEKDWALPATAGQ